MNLIDPDSIRKAIRDASPDVIVNAAGYTAVDKAETEPDVAMQVNAIGPGVIAEEARRIRALLVHYSTDYVFDGTSDEPYVEDDEPNPLNVYGKSKLEGERAIVASGCAHLILRASWIYSNRGTNFVLTILRLARERQELAVVDDQIGSPTWARALAESTAKLLANVDSWENRGVYHLSAIGHVSRFEFAKKIVEAAQEVFENAKGWATVRPITTADYPLPAARPLNCATSKEKIKRVLGIEMADWVVQLRACLADSFGEKPH
jgi:dTDP-4-dehydrorhamnose reductase